MERINATFPLLSRIIHNEKKLLKIKKCHKIAHPGRHRHIHNIFHEPMNVVILTAATGGDGSRARSHYFEGSMNLQIHGTCLKCLETCKSNYK